VQDAKIFAQPLQSATALRQLVRFGEEPQREPPAAASLAPLSRRGPTGFVQNENSLAWPFHDARKPEAAEGNPSLVRLSKTHATDRRSNETPILRIFLGRCGAVLWQPWDSKDFGRETTDMASAAGATTGGDRLRNDDIGLDRRLELFRLQVEIRDCEKRAFDLFLQNMIKGTSHLSLGQEAIAAGFGVAMREGDKSFCTYRGHAHTLARGAPMEGMLGELMLRDIGLMRGKGGSMHLTSVEHGVFGSYAIVGAHLPIACGSAWRAQYLGEKDVAVCFFGDGTTNIGAFHEALNFAAVWKLPVIFVCENNLYMEYTPIGDVTAVKHPAGDRAAAYGLERIIVDGNDADVVYRTAFAALEKAREGGGPSLIECLTYRHSGHSRADPAKYRPPGELEEWLKRDPVDIYRQRLKEFGVEQATIDTIQAESKRKVEAATEACKASPPAPIELLTKDVYADGGWAWRN
jgi:acetoin:2,6-dichlorophenolindophenol oxidoreductase subunit alpha